MAAIKLEQFGGMLPAWDDRLLPAGQAALSINAYLFSGALTGWRAPKLLRTLTNSAAKFAYRVPIKTQATATATLTISLLPLEGDYVFVGEERYIFTAAVTNPYDVLIGATATDAAQNLFNAITLDFNTGVNEGNTYGFGTAQNPAISQITGVNSIVGTEIKLVAPDFGEAYNTTAVSESTSGARMVWNAATFTGGLNQTFDSSITGAAKWMEFEDPDTSIVRSPVVDDKFGRYYIASPSLPPRYNTYDRIATGDVPWLLGINPPGCEPVVAVVGGGNTAVLGYKNAPDAGSPAGLNTVTNQQGPGFLPYGGVVDTSLPAATPALIGLAANSIYLTKIKPDGAMQLNDVSFMPFNTSTTANFVAVLYNDTNGSPGALMNVGANQVGWVAGVEAASPFVNPSGLLANVDYWIGIFSDEQVIIPTVVQPTEDKGKLFTETYSNGPPVTAPTAATAATLQIWGNLTTSSVLASRSYVYTWVTEYDEESAPSPPTLVNGWSNGVWTIGLYQPPAADLGVLRNIKKVKLYRTVTAASGEASFFFVAELAIGTTEYIDASDDSVIALNAIMASTNWFPPPAGLNGIIAMPNGMMVGFRGNEVWFCEPYRPHAWPPQYTVTTEHPIVGLGVIGQSVVAATSGVPYVFTGVNPSSVSSVRVNFPEPCISRGSVLSGEQGVYYMSPNGLILVTQQGSASNTTEFWITRERWRALTPGKNAHAIPLASSYFCFGTVRGGDISVARQGFTIELAPGDSQSFSIWPQPGGHRIGFNQMTNQYDIDTVLVDPWTGIGLFVQNGGVYYIDFADTAPTLLPYKWKSKIYHQTSRKNFEAMKVYFTVPDGTPMQSAVRNTDAVQTLGANQYGLVRVYADGVLVNTRELRTSGELLRIASGFKAEQWQWEFEGRVPISNAQVATSVKELGSV